MLVGGGTDGASVNIGETNNLKSLITQLKHYHGFFGLDAMHLPRTCLQRCFISCLLSAINDLLLCLYYIYEKSPKKSRDITTLIDDLKEVYHFLKGGSIPIRCQGTKWISYKRKALPHIVADMVHVLLILSEDSSVKAVYRYYVE